MKNFELFMGCLGNGITVCNKAVEERGDYKRIAHISNGGNIKFYVDVGYIPSADMERIRLSAKNQREKFLEYWNSLPMLKQYEIMLDELPWGVIVNYLGKENELSLEEKVSDLTAYYMMEV